MLKTKLFNIEKSRTNTSGFWKDEAGKLYKDYIQVISCNYTFKDLKQRLFDNGEKAVFYIKNGIAYIEEKDGKIITLKNKIQIRKKHFSPSFFKALLKSFSGFTVYKKKGYYLFETWQA